MIFPTGAEINAFGAGAPVALGVNVPMVFRYRSPESSVNAMLPSIVATVRLPIVVRPELISSSLPMAPTPVPANNVMLLPSMSRSPTPASTSMMLPTTFSTTSPLTADTSEILMTSVSDRNTPLIAVAVNVSVAASPMSRSNRLSTAPMLLVIPPAVNVMPWYDWIFTRSFCSASVIEPLAVVRMTCPCCE